VLYQGRTRYVQTSHNLETGYGDVPFRKLWQEQTRQDLAIQDLATSLRDMLAFASLARSLPEIEKGINVVQEMCVAIKEAAQLISDYVRRGFVGM
jgi:hypothetical protein